LVIEEARLFFEYGTDQVQVFSVYSFRNPGDEIVIVKLDENSEIPFIRSPAGSTGFSYEPMQNSERFVQIENGFAIPPSEGTYSLVAFASLAKAKELEFSQEFVLPIASLTIFLPEGVTAENTQMTDLGVQPIQNFNFQVYQLDNVGAGDKVAFIVSGTPKEAAAAASTPETTNSNRNLLIGAGALGIALVLAGAWMYVRDRKRTEEEDDVEGVEDEFESSEDVMDAIIALDDLHRARKISDEAYQKRRAELKEILKGRM